MMHFPELVLFCRGFSSLRGEGSLVVGPDRREDAAHHAQFIRMAFQQSIDFFFEQSTHEVLIIDCIP